MKTLNGVLVGIAFTLVSHRAMAHGEDQPGPHGGAIRMPGAFHTELVKKSDQKIWVYLLDVNFEKPIVESSTVKASFKQGQTVSDMNCKPKKLYFECTTAKNQKLKQEGEILITASRNQVTGGVATYRLPLASH